MPKQVIVKCPCCQNEHLLTPLRTVRGEAKKRRPSQSIKAKDEAWAKAIKERDGYRCRRCGKTTELQAAHIFSRAKRATRWTLLNGVCLDAGCHIFWAHKEPYAFLAWAQEQLGEELFDELHRLSEQSKKRVAR